MFNKALLFVLLMSFSANAEDVSELVTRLDIKPQLIEIEKAYKLIPVERQKYSAGASSYSFDEAQYLNKIFTLTDILVSERLEKQTMIQQSFKTGDMHNYEVVLKELKITNPPSGFENAHKVLTSAVEEQILYFRSQIAEKKHFDYNAKLVQSSHGKLLQFYDMLLNRFKDETTDNKKSFYSHLCALDFI